MSNERQSSPPHSGPSEPLLDTRLLTTTYTNYFRASGSAEELILDFGLDAHRHSAAAAKPIVLLQRLVLTWGNAQHLARMLYGLIQRHEQTHRTNANPLPDSPPPPM